MEDRVNDKHVHRDHVQHGIDNDPNNDPQKGAAIGGIGGAVVGAAAGAATGPVGAVIGAVIGGVAGAAASGAAVAAVDNMDDDDTVTGIGDHNTVDEYDDDTVTAYDNTTYETTTYRSGYDPNAGAIGTATHASGIGYNPGNPVNEDLTTTAGTFQGTSNTGAFNETSMDPRTGIRNNEPGIQTGGRAIDGTPDTRGITEKISDAVTGDHVDDKTGKIV